MVSRDILPEALEITENMIWIRCGGGEKKLVMCSVHIPTMNADGETKEEQLIEWKNVRSRGECV